jgi:hypothetical protein
MGSTVLIFADTADADRDSIKKKVVDKKAEAKKRINEFTGHLLIVENSKATTSYMNKGVFGRPLFAGPYYRLYKYSILFM